jgi:hypothetical protein
MTPLFGRNNSYICTYYGSEIIPPKGEEMQEVHIDVSNFRTPINNFIIISFKGGIKIGEGDRLVIEQDRNGVTKAYLSREEGSNVHGSEE